MSKVAIKCPVCFHGKAGLTADNWDTADECEDGRFGPKTVDVMAACAKCGHVIFAETVLEYDEAGGSIGGRGSMSDEWVEGPIQVSIDAIIYRGTFAVHGKVGGANAYVITHLPTGFGMGRDYESEEVAMLAAERLCAMALDWGSFTAEDVARLPREVKRLVQHALSPIHEPAQE